MPRENFGNGPNTYSDLSQRARAVNAENLKYFKKVASGGTGHRNSQSHEFARLRMTASQICETALGS